MNSGFMYGKFNSGKSPVHKLDPRAKLYFLILYLVMVILSNHWIPVAIIGVTAFLLVFISEIPFGNVFRATIGVLVLIILIAFLSLIFVSWQTSLRLFIRLLSLTMTFAVVTMSTRAEDLLAGFMQGFRMSAEDSMHLLRMFTFPAVFGNEMLVVRDAQAARGADVEEGRFFERTLMKIKIMIPRIKAARKRTRNIKYAIRLKAYSKESRRIVERPLSFVNSDKVFLLIGLLMLLGVIITEFFVRI